MAKLAATYHVGFESRIVFSLQQFSPIDTVEKLVCFDLRGALGTKPVLGSTVEQLSQQVLGRRRYNLWTGKLQRFREDLVVHRGGILVIVRR